MKKIPVLILSLFCSFASISCSVRTHEVIADKARSGYAILVPLENPVLCQIGDEWYFQGMKTLVERRGRPCLYKVKEQEKKSHPERYYLVDDESEMEYTPVFASITKEVADRMMKNEYTYSDAISFINTKWALDLPQGDVTRWKTRAVAPAYFRNLSSHRMMQTQSSSYLLARVGEMTADFSSVYMYPLAGLSAVFIDAPGSIFVGPPSSPVQKAESEDL